MKLFRYPASLHLRGDTAPLAYEVRDGHGIVRVSLREGQARRLRESDLPVLDRPLVFAVRRRGDVIQAETVAALQDLLERSGPPAVGRNDHVVKRHQPHRGESKGFRGRGPRGRPRR